MKNKLNDFIYFNLTIANLLHLKYISNLAYPTKCAYSSIHLATTSTNIKSGLYAKNITSKIFYLYKKIHFQGNLIGGRTTTIRC